MAIIHNILIEFGSLGLEILLPSVVICSFEMYESIVDVTIAAKKKWIYVGMRKSFSETHLNSLERKKKNG